MGFEIVDGMLKKYTGKDSEIVIPDGVTSIGKASFRNKKNISKIVISDGVTTICDSAFSGCTGLTELVIPSSVRTIGFEAFSKCIGLKQVIIPDSVEEIGLFAFSDCTGLTSVTISASVKKIRIGAFQRCPNLATIIVDSNNKVYDSRNECNAIIETATDSLVFGCSNTRIPDGIKCIEECAFENCSGIKDIVVPDGVTTIGRDAFYHCENLESVFIPDSVVSIGKNAFASCGNLRNITLPRGWLQANHSKDAEVVFQLFGLKTWSNECGEEYALLYLSQSSKEILGFVNKSAEEKADEIMCGIISLLKGTKKSSYYEKSAEFCINHKSGIRSETIVELFQILSSSKNAKATKAKSMIKPLLNRGSADEDKSCENNESIDSFCKNNFAETALNKLMKKAGLTDKQFGNVRYANSKKKAPAFVVKCAIVPYFEQKDALPKAISNYKKEMVDFTYCDSADHVAKGLDPESFVTALGKICKIDNCSGFCQLLIPLCRFGNDNQIKKVIDSLSLWEDWYKYAANGRKAIITARNALILSDTVTAMKYYDGRGELKRYAQKRNMTEMELRNSAMLPDFGFDTDGVKRFDIGGNVIEARVTDALKIELFDTNAQKVIRSFPKKSDDPAKAEACAKEFAEFKKQVTTFIKDFDAQIAKMYMNGENIGFDTWNKVYREHPVISKLCNLIIWQDSNNHTFAVIGHQIVDSSNAAYSPNGSIKVAHVLDMEPEDIVRWQRLLVDKKQSLLLEQVWEPVRQSKNTVDSSRYSGAVISSKERNLLKTRLKRRGINVSAGEVQREYDHRAGKYVFDPENDMFFDDVSTLHYAVDEKSGDLTLGDFRVKRSNNIRKLNAILLELDRITLSAQIRNDNVEAIEEKQLDDLTVSQISDFIKLATESNAANCTALLLDYKNKKYPEYDNFDEFVLEW